MEVIGTDVSMMRGDSESMLVSMRKKKTKEKIPFIDGDTVYLTIRDQLTSKDEVYHKAITEFDEGNAYFIFDPSDTRDLRPKDYIYDVQLTAADGTVTTIIKPSTFTIEGDVTRV